MLLVPKVGGEMLPDMAGGTSGLILRALGLGDVANRLRVSVDATERWHIGRVEFTAGS